LIQGTTYPLLHTGRLEVSASEVNGVTIKPQDCHFVRIYSPFFTLGINLKDIVIYHNTRYRILPEELKDSEKN
jgi:hypothetical protein